MIGNQKYKLVFMPLCLLSPAKKWIIPKLYLLKSSTAFLTSFYQVNLLPVAVRRGIIRGEPLLHSLFRQQTSVFSTILSSFFLSLRKYMLYSFKDMFLGVGYSDSIDLRPDIVPFFTLFFW